MTKTSFHAVSAFLLAAATVGCSGSLDEMDVAGANLEEGQTQGVLEIRRGSGDDAAPGGEAPAPTLACAPLCQGSCTTIDLATGINSYISIALNDRYVFFGGGYGSEVSDDEVGQVPKGGGVKTILLDGLAYVTEVAASGADAYFVAGVVGLGSFLNRVNRGTIKPLPIIGGYPMAMTVDATHIYWIGNAPYDIYAMPRSGGTPSVVVPHNPAGGLRTTLFVDGDSLYYREIGNLNAIMKVPKSGAAAPILYLQGSNIWYLAFDQTDVYYTSGGYNNTALYRMPKSGGTPVRLATGGEAVVVDKERIYWLDGSTLRAMCKDGTGTQVLAATDGEYALAVDNTGVYWVGDGKIHKIAK